MKINSSGMQINFGLFFCMLLSFSAVSAPESNIRQTKHNFSSMSTNQVKADTESQVCVFCHAPHGGTEEPNAPLWNRKLSPSATYTMYDSLSLDTTDMSSVPGGSSKLCLSCHDGTLAIGSVNVSNGVSNPTIVVQGVQGDGTMPVGAGATTGFTRNIGTDLTNDHPISFTYDTALSLADGELRDPTLVSHVGERLPSQHPEFPTQNGQMQCTTCHDPHLYDPSDPNRKFLRGNRLQKTTPTGGAFNENNDQICLACHDKAGQAWAMSVHANSTDANETYTSEAGALREFPSGTQVWQAGCLNCHDTHTVDGSRRLLREGVDSAGGITTAKTSGNPAIEETCYQCHRPQIESVLTATNNDVPDIRTDFTKSGSVHMPITNSEQQQASEAHNIEDKDFSESKANVGNGNLLNRHVECTDCHNPHRVMKSDMFNDSGSEASGTHNHASGHTNIASGALKGSIGVEPTYTSDKFEANHTLADSIISYTVKKGVPNPGSSTAVSSPYVTREYQVCLRCHSNFGFGTNPPSLGDSGGGTASGTNGVTQLTNQAMEFNPDPNHAGEVTGPGMSTNNHRSWHPVMGPTGRTPTVRGASANSWRAPWNGGVGTQTMYCSDCHGNATTTNSTTPDGDNPWGPHGSTNNFILKGDWSGQSSGNNPGLCFKCHVSNVYSASTSSASASGFCCDGRDNLHEYHRTKSSNYRCTSCHVALPHGWKNKAFLVNLNDVGAEAGKPEGTNVSGNSFTQGPYYDNARLRVINWRKSSQWRADDCGLNNSGKNFGVDWMKDSCG